MKWNTYTYEVNGYEVQARYTKDNEELIFKPLMETIQQVSKQHDGRIFVFLAAPPACGKSTLVKYLCDVNERLGYDNMQWVGMDGFHYPNAYLSTHEHQGVCLKDIKGCPESFDLPTLKRYIQRTLQEDCCWPVYDRNLHEPRQEAMLIHKKIVLLEGNYLLLHEEGWKDLIKYCAYSIFIATKEDYVADRLIERKAKGNLSLNEAISFYEKSDKKNIQRVLEHQLDANVQLFLDKEGVFHKTTKFEY